MYSIKIDSAKISIPLAKCTDVANDLIAYYKAIYVDVETGECFDKETKEKREPYIKHTDYGTYYKIFINNQISSEAENGSEQFIEVLINSKHLGVDYFKGITPNTLELIYNEIMSLNKFKCTFEAFYQSRYTDTDICFDFKCTDESYKVLEKNILSSTYHPEHWHIAKSKSKDKETTKGCYASRTAVEPRKNATNKKPYIKIYSKHYDFTNKSFIFAKHFDLVIQSKDIYRFEFTIKNAEHKKSLGISKINQFGDLLKADLQSIASQMFKCYFSKKKLIRTKKDFMPKDKVIINLMNDLIKKGATRNEIFEAFNVNDVAYNSQVALKELYFKIMSDEIIDKEHLEANKVSSSIFEFLGVSDQLKIDFEEERKNKLNE